MVVEIEIVNFRVFLVYFGVTGSLVNYVSSFLFY